MGKFNILYVSGTSQIGGAEISLLNLIKHLNREVFAVIAALPCAGPLMERLKTLGVDVVTTGLQEFSKRRCFSFGGAVFALSRLIRKKGVDLVHANSIYIAEQSLFAAKLAGVPCVGHVRDLVPVLGGGKVRKAAFNKMDKIIAISEAVKRDLVEKIGVSEKKVTKIYNGVDTEEFNPSVSGESFRKELNLGPVKLVGMVGRFTPEKGQDLFLRAAAKVIDEYRDVCFAVIGDAKLGSEQFKQAMINLSVELGLENKVIFTGFRDDLPRVMAALDIVVVSSVAEPFGRVIVEALAMEKGVVVSDSGAIPEIVSNDCGILVNPEDNEGFKEAILGLLTDTQRCKGLGESGRRIVEEKFGIKRHVSEMEGLYKKLGFFSMSDNCFMQKPTDYRVFNESYYKDSSAPVLADKETEQFQHREVARFASQGLNKGARILNIGCGVGLLSHRLSEYCERVISVDVSQYAVEKARSMYGDKKSWFTRANAEYLPFKSEIFDCVVASHLFTHLTDEQAKKAQKEIYRVTKKGGNLVVEQPLCGKKSIPDAALLLLFSSWKVKKYYCNSYKAIKRAKKDNSRADFHHLEGVGDPTHRRIYDPRLLIDELLKAGFKTFKFSRRKIFSILFFNRQDLFESYVKFYIKVPEIIRRLFLIDIGGRVKAIKDE